MVAPAIASLMWKLMTHPDFGIFSYLLGLFGIHDFRWASAPSSALFTVILVDVWVYTPFIMILLLAGLRSLPRQPFEAAELDGVPASFVFFRITLPMLMPYIITAALFRMLDSIQQFDIVYAMTQGGPGNATLLFQVQAYLDFFKNFNVGRSAAMLMVLWLIANLLSTQFIKHWLRLRERARGGAAEMERTRSPRTDRPRRPADAGGPVLPVPDLLGLPDVVPDERARSCGSRPRSFFAPTLEQLRGPDLGQADQQLPARSRSRS